MERSVITDLYLSRLGLQRSAPTLDLLERSVRGHVAAFAFSSLGPRLGDDLPLDLDALYDRIVVRRRGGYCFEQNALMFEVLQDLGFSARLYLGRVMVNGNPDPALTHRVTVVDLDGVEYLVDVGFGPLGPRGPVPVAGEHGTHRVAEVAPGEIHVQSSSGGDAVTLYRFERSTYGPADCELGHFYSHRHPRASFVNNLVASRILDDEVRSLRNHDYWVMRDSGTVTRTVSSAEDLRVILTQEMDLLVTEDESVRLFAELPDPA